MNGVLNIDKPAGMTSHDVVAQVRRLARVKRVGHAGTLDPDATGVLLVCVGQATRIADLLTDAGKEYQAVLALGCTTSTEDAGGEVLTQTEAAHITQQQLQELLPRFTGSISQIPPMVSAVHHEGKRLYELARAGITVERQPRQVQIDKITLESFQPGARPTAALTIACGKGTYIRTLCADLGAALGVGGYMAALRRTQVGSFSLADSVPHAALTKENLAASLIAPVQALSTYPMVRITSQEERTALSQGRDLPTQEEDGTTVCVVDQEQSLLALGRVEGGVLHPYKVFL
jgi:tRNA pseudouridine55 synthase